MKGDFPLQFLDSRVSQRAQPSLIGSASHPPAPTAALLLTNKVCVLSAIAHCMHEPVGPAPVMTAVPSVLGSAPVSSHAPLLARPTVRLRPPPLLLHPSTLVDSCVYSRFVLFQPPPPHASLPWGSVDIMGACMISSHVDSASSSVLNPVARAPKPS
jgi:hypothetical protein